MYSHNFSFIPSHLFKNIRFSPRTKVWRWQALEYIKLFHYTGCGKSWMQRLHEPSPVSRVSLATKESSSCRTLYLEEAINTHLANRRNRPNDPGWNKWVLLNGNCSSGSRVYRSHECHSSHPVHQSTSERPTNQPTKRPPHTQSISYQRQEEEEEEVK